MDFERTKKSKYKVTDTKGSPVFFNTLKDAEEYLREQKQTWYKDFRNGFFGDCARPFKESVTYAAGRYVERHYDNRRVEIKKID